MLGAIIFGLAGHFSFGNIIDAAIDAYLQGEYVLQENTNKYWFLVFSPFFILPLLCINVSVKKIAFKRVEFNCTPIVFFVALCFILILFFGEIFLTNNTQIITLSALSSSKEDYSEYIIGRNDIYSNMSNRFFGYLYITLPFFSHVSISKAFSKKSPFWIVCSVVLVLIIIIVSIGINQKAPLIIYFISIFIGISLYKKLSRIIFFIIPLFILATINIIQVFVQGDDGWGIMLSIFHTLFRAPSSLAYYVNYFPNKLDFVGIDFGISSFLHLPTNDVKDNIEIHTIMWGQSFEKLGIEGSVAAPFHFRAYAQAGLFFSIFNFLLVALFIRFIAFIIKKPIITDNSMSFGLYAQSLIILYYLSQTHIRDCIWSSYGLVWLLHGFLIIFFVGLLLKINLFRKY